MSRYKVEDWRPGTDLLRIVDTVSESPSYVVGYIEPAGEGFWIAWFRPSNHVKHFLPTVDCPSGCDAIFSGEREAIAAVEALSGPLSSERKE